MIYNEKSSLFGDVIRIRVNEQTGKISKINHEPDIVKVESFTEKGLFYDVDMKNSTCTCMAYQKNPRKCCKHLESAFGIKTVKETGVSISLLKSAIQKAVRRCDVESATRCAKEFISLEKVDKKNSVELVRRLAVIVLEDVILHPDYFKLIEMISRLSIRTNFLTEDDKDFLINFTAQLAQAEVRDDFIHVIKVKYGHITYKDIESKLEYDEELLVKAIKHRASIGGMGGDITMLNEYARVWSYRFIQNEITVKDLKSFYKPTNYKYNDVGILTSDYILKESVDFHCSPLLRILIKKQKVIDLVKQYYPSDDVEAKLKDIIWRMRSVVCYKKQLGVGRSLDPFLDYPHLTFPADTRETYKNIFNELKHEIDNISVWFIKKQLEK